MINLKEPGPSLLRTLFAAVLLLGIALVTYTLLLEEGSRSIRRQSTERLSLVAATIESRIARYRALPPLIAETRQVRDLFQRPTDNEPRDAANKLLATLKSEVGAAAMFLLDDRGLCLAASNWDQPQSLIGQSYGFRPYFSSAIEKGRGSYYGVGVTTGKPGLFLSAAISNDGSLGGVIVVKIDLEPLEKEWVTAGESVGVADSLGVVFLSSRADWKYRPISSLDEFALDTLAAEQRYSGRPLNNAPIFMPKPAMSGRDGIIVENQIEGGTGDLLFSYPLDEKGWSLFLVADKRETLWRAAVGAAAAGLAALVALLTALLWRMRADARRRERKAKNLLEHRVAERTAELSTMNIRLAEEIAERRRTEAELHNTREGLLQAAKLAAIGQTLAGLAHEINQPLAALRTYLASTRLMAERGLGDALKSNIDTMIEEIDRMASLTERLTRLARSNDRDLVELDLRATVDRIVDLLKFRTGDLTITMTVSGDEHLDIIGEAGRIDQVILNLLSNAIDAVTLGPERVIRILVEMREKQACLEIADSGPGLDESAAARLFEPFFTTKEPGRGLGLGLATVYAIVREHAATITASRSSLGGACFTISFPMLQKDQSDQEAVA